MRSSISALALLASGASAAPPHAAIPSTFPHLPGPLVSVPSTLASVPVLLYRAGTRPVAWSGLTSPPMCKSKFNQGIDIGAVVSVRYAFTEAEVRYTYTGNHSVAHTGLGRAVDFQIIPTEVSAVA